MNRGLRSTLFLLLLSAVFTVGLTFTTVELPRVIDRAVQDTVRTPGFDSHVDAVSRLKTELFIAHYHLRAVGYVCFTALLVLIVAGFAGRRTGLATLGGLAFMLPVFAQFAGVMFFLAGLGLLNVVWLPVLDISLELSRLGLVIRAPYDVLRWLLGQVGISGYWPVVVFFIGSGLMIFFLGTFAWLSARARGQAVAESWVYRISRHPQYLGWILWSYGVYLLLERGMYPRRSWGISASLPWLLATMVILGVAMLEELRMRRDHREAYEPYRRSAPFLLPLPAFLERALTLPCRVVFKRPRPERKREVAAVVALYTLLLMGLSALYDGGAVRLASRVLPTDWQVARVERLADAIRQEPNPRRQWALADRLARSGDVAVEPLRRLLEDDDAELRALAAERMTLLRPAAAVPPLLAALADPVGDVRYRALRGLSSVCGPECVTPVQPLLDDPEVHNRVKAMQLLADLESPVMVSLATQLMDSPERWQRAAAADALGALASPDTVSVLAARLDDPEPTVRRSVVVALLRIGSPASRVALEAAADDADWEVRVYAAEALKRSGS